MFLKMAFVILENRKVNDYISRQAAIVAFYKHPNIDWTTLDVLRKIDALPTADVREVKRGRWIGIDDEPHETWECDQCGFIQECFDGDQWKFCPNCGADMRENGDDV